MRGWVVMAALLTTLGCGREDADGWAKDKLGADADVLRKECMDAYERALMVAGGIQPDPAVYLPRPAVVLEPPPKFGEMERLRYHRINPKLDETFGAIGDVRGCAVVSYGIWDSSRFVRVKSGHVAWIPDGTPFIQVVAIDRATKQGRLHVAAGDGDSDTIDLIAKLPQNGP